MNNSDIKVVALNAASASGVSNDLTNPYGSGLQLAIDVTAIAGTTPSITVTIKGKDTTSGKYYPLLTSAAITATGTTILTVYPGVTVAANVSASTPLPKTWRVEYTIAGTTPTVTATIGASVIN